MITDYQRGRLGPVIAALPNLIKSAQALEESSTAATDSRCWMVSARVHHLTASVLTRIGEADLSWIAAERAMSAAERSGDPLSLASAARAGTHALLAVGRFDDALNLGQTAAVWLQDHLQDDDPAALSIAGMLSLRTATAAAPLGIQMECGVRISAFSASVAPTAPLGRHAAGEIDR